MMSNFSGRYTGKILKINLTNGISVKEILTEDTIRSYLGGTGLGVKFLYEKVLPGVEWSASENIMVWASGPLGGTTVPGSGNFSIVTKGCLTGGITSTQASGFFGAYLKQSGFDAIIIEGTSKNWCYLYIHDGLAEIKRAYHLISKSTWETEDMIKAEIGLADNDSSVFCIGPAGENLVKFAAIVGDRGHVAAHNGVGTVMGSKKLKAIAIARGKAAITIKKKELLHAINKEIIQNAKMMPPLVYDWGTSMLYDMFMKTGQLPIKNLTTAEFPDYAKFVGEKYRSHLEMKWSPCWACQAHHCHIVKVLEGPYAGYVGEEPEYEALAGWGSLIGQSDLGAAIMLSNEADRLGMDTNEASWLTAMLMECYERGIISKKDTDGIELTWGNAESAKTLLFNIAYRQGFGNVLAEGIVHAALTIGGDAKNIGVYVNKGHAPRGHDHRANWAELFDTATSNVATIETGGVALLDKFSPLEVSTRIAQCKGARLFKDSLGICLLSTGTYLTNNITGVDKALERLISALTTVTGWEINQDDAIKIGLRIANLARAFNLRHGITVEVETPSTRYSSTPLGGLAKGKNIVPHWEEMLDNFYHVMGWDRKTGKPLPDTLKSLDLDHIVGDLWS